MNGKKALARQAPGRRPRKSDILPPPPVKNAVTDETLRAVPHQRTLRDLYGDAVRARVGLTPDERNMDENPAAMSAGEMLLWTLGGCTFDQELTASLGNLANDILALVMAPEAHGAEGLPADVCDALHGFVNRLQVIRYLHNGALERLAQIVAPEITEQI
ncbi:MAG TPA: hypothetical protein VJT73_17205 [Polyangiaceae bacterium]|nr:hypothetical protein [Polyangiaceae bacterium]